MAATHQPDPCPTPARGSLNASYPSAVIVGALSCKRWSCPSCARRNARSLRRRLDQVHANRFMTLTYRMHHGQTTDQATIVLKHAWTAMRKRIARRERTSTASYVLVIEWTRAQSPHLHVLLQSGFLPQRWLSRQWRELTDSPVVDIRRIRSTRDIANYLASYLSKSQVLVRGCHKYSYSRGMLPPVPPRQWEECDERPEWFYSPIAPWSLANDYHRAGWTVLEHGPDAILCIPPAETPTSVEGTGRAGWASG